MMPNAQPVCPCCGLAERSYKVSAVYLECSARLHQRQTDGQQHLDRLLREMFPEGSPADQPRLSHHLLRLLTPPAGQKRAARLIHPDWMMIFLGAVGLGISYQLYRSQPELSPVVVTLLIAVLLGYFLARKPVLERYLLQYRRELEGKARVERAVGRWMRLYICTAEPCIYDPLDNRFVPVDRLGQLLNE